MKIIGIDPGFDRNGIAIIERGGKKDELVFSLLIQTDNKEVSSLRLASIAEQLEKILSDHKPDLLIIEQLFLSK
ncbi:MAG: Crossover junction endodeoxyribonuclease RuvC, partial [Candidatus Parcubacteria bacterium]